MITNKYLRKLVWGFGFGLLCVIFAALYSFFTKKNKRTILSIGGYRKEIASLPEFIMFSIMVIWAGIRLNVGSDYYNYYILFNSIKRNVAISWEKITSQSGFVLLSYIVKKFTDYEYAIFWVVAVIIYGFCFYFILMEVQDKAAAFTCYLFLGFFANSINILKQCIAMMFVIGFYRSLRDKRIVQCVTFAILAITFHYSTIFAVVIIGVLTAIKIQPSMKLFYIAVVTGVLALFFLPQILLFIIRLVPAASGYEVYINWRRNNQIRLVLAVAGTSLIYLFLIYNIVNRRKQIREINEYHYLEITFLLVGLVINIASIRIWLLNRIALYFYQFIIFVLPTMFQSININERKKIKRRFYLIMFAYLIFNGIFMGENEYYSYNTVFSGDVPIYDADYNRMINGW